MSVEFGVFKEALTLKLAVPKTTLALSPLVNGFVNSRTLPLLVSATQRLPLESKAIELGERRSDGVAKDPFLKVKLLNPMTMDAFSPLEKA